MKIAQLAVPLILSRLGDMTASFLFLAVVGNLLPDFIAEASFAWAFSSFITVIGIGLFSVFLIEVARTRSTDTETLSNLVASGLILALKCGFFITFIVLTYTASQSGASQRIPISLQALLTISWATPALYCQIIVFNFFNAQGNTKYELIYTWSFNIFYLIASVTYVHYKPEITIIEYIIAYVFFRWLGVALIILMIFRFELPGHLFRHKKTTFPMDQVNLFKKGIPLALCFGGESFLYFALTLISKHLGDAELSTYQITLHFLSIIYMISIGIGNASAIIISRSHSTDRRSISRSVLAKASTWGSLLMTPCLFVCLLLPEKVALLYTSSKQIASMVAEAIQLSVAFLVFEFFYVLTRMVLRSLGDSWVPTTLTLICLNGGGLIFTWVLFHTYEASIKSIILGLTGCTFVLMVCLLTRFYMLTRANQ